ncbi:hypothetical protein Golob_005291 [Gossypium lobatum]|nr:hypothetical protein [Gossypium lobatum]
MSGWIVDQSAQRHSTITFLELSYCRKIDAYTIKAIGKHCKLLVTLPQLAPTGFGYHFPNRRSGECNSYNNP